MKSLEHLIREIQEGKTEKCEKKTLEGSIRKVMSKESSWAAKDSKPVEEHCGCEEEKKKKVSKEDGDKLPGAEDKMDEAIGTIGTDKYQGNEFKSIRTATPHIKPPAGPDSHSQAPENASRQRSIAKEKIGINRVEEGAAAKVLPYLDDLARFVTKGPKAGAAPKIKPVAPEPIAPTKPNIPDSTPPTKVPAPETPKPANDPAPSPKPANDPGKPSVKPSEKPAQAPAETPGQKPSVKPQVAPVTAPEVAPALAPEVAPKVAIEPAPKLATEPAPKAAISPSPKVALEPAPTPKPGTGKSGNNWKLPRINMSGLAATYDTPGKPYIHAPHKVHGTKAHKHFKEAVESGTEVRKKIFDMPIGGERKKTSYVGRPEDDVKGTSEKLSRQGQYKLKIIDEGKKLASIVKKTTKEYESSGKTKVFDRGEDVIIVNPEMNKNTLDTK